MPAPTPNSELDLGQAVLKLIEFKIDALLGHQFGMGSDLTNPPFMEDDDPIGVLDRGKPMSNDNRRSSFE